MHAVTRGLGLLLIAGALPACADKPAPTTGAAVTEEAPGTPGITEVHGDAQSGEVLSVEQE